MKEHKKQQKARKAYVCDVCFDEIPAGNQYIQLNTEENGRWREKKMHIHCDILRCECPDKSIPMRGFGQVAEWIGKEVCTECGVGECGGNPFACGKVIDMLVPPNLKGAAQDSIRQSGGWV